MFIANTFVLIVGKTGTDVKLRHREDITLLIRERGSTQLYKKDTLTYTWVVCGQVWVPYSTYTAYTCFRGTFILIFIAFFTCVGDGIASRDNTRGRHVHLRQHCVRSQWHCHGNTTICQQTLERIQLLLFARFATSPTSTINPGVKLYLIAKYTCMSCRLSSPLISVLGCVLYY